MGKYLEVTKIYMKTQLVWRADVIFNMIFTITKILFAYLLWGMVYQNKEVVGQFTFHAMLSYYIVSSFLSQLEMSEGISSEIHDRIRNGTFSKYMVIPVGIQKYFMAMELGIVLFYIVFDFIAAVVWIFVFQIQFVFATNVLLILCAMIMAILGMIFMVQLNYFLGLLTLKYQGIGTFLMIKNSLVALVTGSIMPLVLFPEMIVKMMRLLPFYYVTYLPAMLFTGRCREETVTGIAVISCWCLLMQLLIHAVWKKYLRKYDGVGI
ncbi:MAG: ABC-2 family transporter protein [Eubacterium sp.]|nr:ABC-2 family transporter protein [Eubacterium sp.]